MTFFVKFHRDGTVSLANRVVGTVKKVAADKWQFESADLLGSGTFRTRRDVRPVAREVHKRLVAAVHGHKLAD